MPKFKSAYPQMSPEMQERIALLDQQADQNSQAFLAGNPLPNDPINMILQNEAKSASQDAVGSLIRRLLEQEKTPRLNPNVIDHLNLLERQMIQDQKDADANESILPDPDLKPYWR